MFLPRVQLLNTLDQRCSLHQSFLPSSPKGFYTQAHWLKTFEGALGKDVVRCDTSSKLATNCFLGLWTWWCWSTWWMVMNDIISKSNQPNAPTRPAFLPSFLPTANHCSENCGHFAARLLCLGSLSENYLPIVCGYSEFVCQAKLLCLGCLLICTYSTWSLCSWMFPQRLYSWFSFVKQEFTTKVRRRICHC